MQTQPILAVLGDNHAPAAKDTWSARFEGGLVYEPKRVGTWFSNDDWSYIPQRCVKVGVMVKFETTVGIIQHVQTDTVKIQSGTILPQNGLQWKVSSVANYLDFASMYPNCMISFNLGHDSLLMTKPAEGVKCKHYVVEVISDKFTSGNPFLKTCEEHPKRKQRSSSKNYPTVREKRLNAELCRYKLIHRKTRATEREPIAKEIARLNSQIDQLYMYNEFDVWVQDKSQHQSGNSRQLDTLLTQRALTRSKKKINDALLKPIKKKLLTMSSRTSVCDACMQELTTATPSATYACGHTLHTQCYVSECKVCLHVDNEPNLVSIDSVMCEKAYGEFKLLQLSYTDMATSSVTLEVRQLALKVMANSIYGLGGTNNIYMRNVLLASLITQLCRNMNRACVRLLSDKPFIGWQQSLQTMWKTYTMQSETIEPSALYAFNKCIAASSCTTLKEILEAYPNDSMTPQETLYGDTVCNLFFNTSLLFSAMHCMCI